jgi:hypothetical protein
LFGQRRAVLLPDAAAWVQRLFANSRCVLIDSVTRQDTAPDQAGDGRIAAELELIKWRVVVLKFHAEAGAILSTIVLLSAHPPHFLISDLTDVKIIRTYLDVSVGIKSNFDHNLPTIWK